MNLEYKPEAVKQIRKLQNTEKKKIIRKLEQLALDPFSGKLLKAELEGLRSLRAWPYRIIYKLNRDTLTIFSVVHRQSAY